MLKNLENTVKVSGPTPLLDLQNDLGKLGITDLPQLRTFTQQNVVHLLAACIDRDGNGRLRDFNKVSALPLYYYPSARSATLPEALCADCFGFIIDRSTPERVHMGDQIQPGSPARLLRVLYLANKVLQQSINLTTAPVTGDVEEAASHNMKILRAKSSMFGWRNQLQQQLKAAPEAQALAQLLQIVDKQIAAPLPVIESISNGHEMAVSYFKKDKLTKLDKKNIYTRQKQLVGLWEKTTFNKVVNDTLDEKLKKLQQNWTLVFIPHLPEVPVAAAYLKHLTRLPNKYWISGFAVIPQNLALYLAHADSRSPKIEKHPVADSTSKNAERVSYVEEVTIIPIEHLKTEQIDQALNEQALDLAVYLWQDAATGQGFEPGTLKWAQLAPDFIQVARTLLL